MRATEQVQDGDASRPPEWHAHVFVNMLGIITDDLLMTM
jgi:hypothetical protein